MAAAALAGCDGAPLLCRDELVAGAPSPDGAYVADVSVRDCHRTSGYTVHVALRSSRERHVGDTIVVLESAKAPLLVWRGPRRLVVLPPDGVRVLDRRPSWNDVAVAIEAPPAQNAGLLK